MTPGFFEQHVVLLLVAVEIVDLHGACVSVALAVVMVVVLFWVEDEEEEESFGAFVAGGGG